MSKKDSNNEDEVKELAEIYAVLKQDAKSIITDLEGGVAMWREAAAGAVTAVGFIAIISLTLDQCKEGAWEPANRAFPLFAGHSNQTKYGNAKEDALSRDGYGRRPITEAPAS